MLKSVIKAYPQDDIRVFVVWLPMLPNDDKDAARETSAMFPDDRRVHQFWDPDRRSGVGYSRDTFPTSRKDMASAVPPGDPLYEPLKARAEVPPEDAPHWDVVFLYRPGIRWTDKLPKPSAFTKQIAFFGKQNDRTSGIFFADDYTKPPRKSDWFVELANAMRKLTQSGPAAKSGREDSSGPHRAGPKQD